MRTHAPDVAKPSPCRARVRFAEIARSASGSSEQEETTQREMSRRCPFPGRRPCTAPASSGHLGPRPVLAEVSL